MVFNCTAESVARPWTHVNSNKALNKVAPLDVNSLKLGGIPEENLNELEKVDEVLCQKRLSVVR